ncbi:hypothetical protein LTR82_003062 [Friedmanniomyces endolithicus]|uniref:EF-hand domain-containing protein n=1 Tax=Friedmanniomyces endolithicus TaxID=329885 RepID=A0AAN6FYG4_9PEZI|nr:hypothetical protein LTR82_003062 [Friedmanniomyces endolithicus]
MPTGDAVVDIELVRPERKTKAAANTASSDMQNDPATIREVTDFTYLPSRWSHYQAITDPDAGAQYGSSNKPLGIRWLAVVRSLTKSELYCSSLVFFLPIAVVLTLPILIAATAGMDVSIGDVHLVGLFVWIEVVWLILWGVWSLAYIIPYVVQFLAGFITANSRRYGELLQAISLPMTLFLWAILSRAITPILCSFDRDRPGDCDDDWVLVLRKILIATVASTGFFFVEKILVHLLTINYRKKQYSLKRQEIEQITRCLVAMYETSIERYPVHGPEFPGEDDKLHGLRPIQEAEHAFNGSSNTAASGKRRSRIAYNMKKRLAGKQVVNADSAQTVVLHALEKAAASEALAIRLYRSFAAAGSEHGVSEADMTNVLGPGRAEEAQDIFHALDKDENGDVSLEEMIALVTQTGRDKDSMRRSMHDIGQAIKSLDNLLLLVVLFAAGLVYAAFFSDVAASRITTLWGSIAAASFAISGTVQEFLGSCIFVFVKHIYDLGDLVVINNTHMTVQHISLMYSVFRQVDSGSVVQIPNQVNNNAWIKNFSRSKGMLERYDFAISAKTKFPAIEHLKVKLQAFVLAPENKRNFRPDIDVELISVGNMKELQLRVESNFADETLRKSRRSKFMCALLAALRKHDISSPGGGGPAPNPGYSVALTDVDAIEARNKYEAVEEAKRQKKLGGERPSPSPHEVKENEK